MKRPVQNLLLILCIILSPVYIASSENSSIENDKQTNVQSDDKPVKRDDSFIHEWKVKMFNYIIQENLPRKVDFDRMNINMIPDFGSEIYNLRIAENPVFGDSDFITTEYSQVEMKFLPFLIGYMDITEMIIKKPMICILKNSKGLYNTADLLKRVMGKKIIFDWMEIKKLFLHECKINYIDESQTNGPVILNMDLFDVQMEDFALDKLSHIKIQGRIPGGNKMNFKMNGYIGPMKNNRNLNEVPLDVSVIMDEISIDPYMAFIPQDLPFGVVSAISNMNFQIKRSMPIEIAVLGEIRFNDLIMKNMFDSTHSKKVTMNINLNDKTKYWPQIGAIDFGSWDVTIDGHKYYVQGKINGIHDKSCWDIAIRTSKLNVKDFDKIYPNFGQNFPFHVFMRGLMDMELLCAGKMDDMTGLLNIGMRDLEIIFPDLIQKQRSVPGEVHLQGEKDYKNNISAEGDFKFKEMELMNDNLVNELFNDLLNEILKIKKISKYKKNIKKEFFSFMNNLKKTKPVIFKQICGAFSMQSSELNFKKIHLDNIQMKGLNGSYIYLKGVIDINTEIIKLKCKVFLSREYSKKFVKAATPLKALLNSEDCLMLPFSVHGNIYEPIVSLNLRNIVKNMD